MTQEELDKIVEQHQHWLKEDCEGWKDMRADLRNKNLSGLNLKFANLESANLEFANLESANLEFANLKFANLKSANLEFANLKSANLEFANLESANLKSANLKSANLEFANLESANLKSANLKSANLKPANLESANLESANLKFANLEFANLKSANLESAEKIRLGKVLDEPLTGYKKTKEGVVITAEIPAGAIVFCINGSKCRTNRAKITDMAGHDVLHSQYDDSFEYRLGQEIEIKDFNLMYNVECASGFHFFRTRKEAEEY